MFGFAYVGNDGSLARQLVVGSLWGSIAVTGSNWVFNPDTVVDFISAEAVTGSGTFSPKVSMDGTYSVGGGSSRAFGPLTYSSANALAVNQSSVAGTWVSDASSGIGVSITVDATGAFTGSTSGAQIGVCNVSGTLTLAQPGTAKNAFIATLNAVNAATGNQTACQLQTSPSYVGPSAIVFLPAGNFVGNGYFRSIAMTIRHATTTATLSVLMRKQ
jgi:hypothetical protein